MPLTLMHARFQRLAVPVLLALMTALPAGADRIRLKNGNSVDGIITRETPSGVLLQVGGGTIAFRRSEIKTIERAPTSSNTVMVANWRDKYFLNRAYVPAGFEPLATRFRALDDRRRQAIDAHNSLRQASDTLHGIERELADLQDEYRSSNATMTESSPTNDLPRFPSLLQHKRRNR